MRLDISTSDAVPADLVKIGAVAHRFGVSPDLLRLYEREGVLIPLKSLHGTRYFSGRDYAWIEMLLHLVRGAHINLAAIRHLLAVLPCWQTRQCEHQDPESCPIRDRTRPCWFSRVCCNATSSDCYFCAVYRSAPTLEPLRALLVQASRCR